MPATFYWVYIVPSPLNKVIAEVALEFDSPPVHLLLHPHGRLGVDSDELARFLQAFGKSGVRNRIQQLCCTPMDLPMRPGL
ncbi:hypothetical protein D3C81_1783910 [compost metagenome]